MLCRDPHTENVLLMLAMIMFFAGLYLGKFMGAWEAKNPNDNSNK